MKNAFIKLSGLSLLLAGACLAEFQVGNGALQLDTSLTGVYDSNLRASVNNVEDYYLSFQPTLRYRHPGARFATEASAGLRIRRYLDTTTSNSEDADLRFDWDMKRGADGHTTGANLGFRYFETTEANLDVNDLVRTKTFSANASGEVLMAERNLLSAGVSYHDSNRNLGSDHKSSNTRLGYTYLGLSSGSELNLSYSHQESKSTQNTADIHTIDQKGDTLSGTISKSLYDQLRGGLTYGYRWLDRGEQEALMGLNSTKGSFVALNFDGPFLPRQYFPKTTGTFRIAYEKAETPGLNDRNNERLVGQVNISWAARENTNVGFYANRSQDLSITDNTVVNQTTGLTLRQAVGAFVDTDFSLSYTRADFVNLDRKDNRYEARAGATYRINRTWSSGVSYRYLKSDSNAAVANYTRHIVSGNVNYAF